MKIGIAKATTVDSIVSEFNKTIDKLRSHANAKEQEAAKYQQEIAFKQMQMDNAKDEAKRADAVSFKLSELIGNV